MLDEPRLLRERALEPLNLSEPPPNADSLPLPRETSRCPTRSPAPAARLLEAAPARSRAAAPAWLARSPAAARAWPATPEVPTAPLCRAPCRLAWRLAIESPRAVPPYLFAVERFW